MNDPNSPRKADAFPSTVSRTTITSSFLCRDAQFPPQGPSIHITVIQPLMEPQEGVEREAVETAAGAAAAAGGGKAHSSFVRSLHKSVAKPSLLANSIPPYN